MCGFAGLLDPRGRRTAVDLEAVSTAMSEALRHRGPDDGGVWVDETAGLALGSRRLAIVDLTSDGHQPMASRNGRFVVAYNGEIYNHVELRERLEAKGRHFRGHSDTEVLVEAVDEWGLHEALQRFNGMFAFALWDRHDRTVHLARDRIGEKPLYYGWVAGTLLFGSELKALRELPGFDAEVDRQALAAFLKVGYVPAPLCIYEGLRQVEPGCSVAFDVHATPGSTGLSRRYWSAFEVAAAGTADPLTGDHAVLVGQLEDLLGDATRLRLRADVEVGAFLSGGIDSSLIVALMASRSASDVRTFTVGFDDVAYDESSYAAAVAGHLGTCHTELRLSSGDAASTIPDLPRLYDEPFADSSQIPTFLVSRLAGRHVKVALSGDGGDELFGGYNRHAWGARVWAVASKVPLPARRAASALLESVPPSGWDRAFAAAGPLLPPGAKVRNPGIKVHKLASALPAANPADLYDRLASAWPHPERLLVDPVTDRWAPHAAPDLGDMASQMMFQDLVGYLPGDILVKLDRAAMGVSLESRVPFLDHRVVELAWRMPAEVKIRAGTGKWILRQVLRRHVPEELFDRPKAGFGLPIGAWLRGPLREWAGDMMSPSALKAGGFLRSEPVQSAWREHLAGGRDLEARLWPILMFQAWLDFYASPDRPRSSAR